MRLRRAKVAHTRRRNTFSVCTDAEAFALFEPAAKEEMAQEEEKEEEEHPRMFAGSCELSRTNALC